MNRVTPTLPTGPGHREPSRRLQVLVVYEDFSTGIRGKQLFERLIQGFGPAFTLECRLWKFDVLKVRALRDMAAEDAAMANVIVIAAHGNTGLPQAVREWIETWPPRGRSEPAALVYLADPPQETEPLGLDPIHQLLKAVGHDRQMEFFCAGAEAGPAAPASPVTAGVESSATAPLLGAVLRHSAASLQFGIDD